MKNPALKFILILFVLAYITESCSSAKVLSAWKAEQNVVEKFKAKNVLVIARTSNNQARIAFENAITDALKSKGIKATPSFTKLPKIHANTEVTEERVKLVKEIMDFEGYNGVVLTVVKDKKQTTTTSNNGVYVGASYADFYPGYYGGFYNYFSRPYAFGPYYSSFGGYVPVSSSTYTSTDYILETVAYNLDGDDNNQLVAVVTTQLNDPNEASKAAEDYVKEIMKSLEEQ
jgi:hypothetical protein